MTTVTIPIELNNHQRMDVKIDENVFERYLYEFMNEFSDKIDRLFRIGTSSKKVIFERRMYGDIAEFASHLVNAKDLEKSIIALNQDKNISEVGYTGWISLDDYVLEKYEGDFIDLIKKKHVKEESESETTLQTQTYKFNGEEVVFYLFDNPSSGYSIYAVPVEVAKRIHLEDYDGEEISRNEDFLDEIEPFELSHISSYNTD